MKTHTTKYHNIFIATAPDCPATKGEAPPVKPDKATIANLQFDMVSYNSYKYTSDDILLQVFMIRNQISEEQREATRKQLFSKDQPCFRTSPLAKRYGWGIHFDENGKITIFGRETDMYKSLLSDDTGMTRLKAMK